MNRLTKVALAAMTVFGVMASAAWGAVTPGWECIPATAGQAVVSGGTGASPACAGGSTAVLAPTYVSSGVGGKPTAEFSSVNVQIVSGSGATSGATNGEGNLVVGYAENPGGYAQSGSNDLVVGPNNGWSGYGDIVGGNNNQALGNYATAVGLSNKASGAASFSAGASNTAFGSHSSVSGGTHNVARGIGAAVAGGDANNAKGSFASILGGFGNTASGNCQAIPLAPGSC
jgi:hypothetical protein